MEDDDSDEVDRVRKRRRKALVITMNKVAHAVGTVSAACTSICAGDI